MSNEPVIIQFTLDQLMLGIGVAMFLAIIWRMSEHPALATLAIAAIALTGYLLIGG